MESITRYSAKLKKFFFQKKWSCYFLNLTDEDAGKMIKEIIHFVNYEARKTVFDDMEKEEIFRMITTEIESTSEYHWKYVERKKSQEESSKETTRKEENEDG